MELSNYCKAFHLKSLFGYQGPEKSVFLELNQPELVVFIHEDYTVTKSIYKDAEVILNAVSSDWRNFCESELQINNSNKGEGNHE